MLADKFLFSVQISVLIDKSQKQLTSTTNSKYTRDSFYKESVE